MCGEYLPLNLSPECKEGFLRHPSKKIEKIIPLQMKKLKYLSQCSTQLRHVPTGNINVLIEKIQGKELSPLIVDYLLINSLALIFSAT